MIFDMIPMDDKYKNEENAWDKAMKELQNCIFTDDYRYDKPYKKYIKRVDNRNKLFKKLKRLGR